MSRIIQAKKKLSRKLEANLWGRANDTFAKKNCRPGEHGADTKGKMSDYKTQLTAKQKIRFFYNMSEKQFRNLFNRAVKSKADTILAFLQLLESRLDMVVYRADMAPTIFSARQLVTHKHVKVNGKTVNIPSYLVQPGDVIEIKDKSKSMSLIVDALEKMERDVPVYLKLDKDAKKVEYIATPLITDVVYPFEVELNSIVELYSK